MSMMDFKLEKSGFIAILTLRGNITDADENTLRSLLMKLLYGFDHIVLNFNQVTGITASCRRLFYGACSTSIRLKKSINMICSAHGQWDINNYSEALPVQGGKV